jgi:hypothetical protein
MSLSVSTPSKSHVYFEMIEILKMHISIKSNQKILCLLKSLSVTCKKVRKEN